MVTSGDSESGVEIVHYRPNGGLPSEFCSECAVQGQGRYHGKNDEADPVDVLVYVPYRDWRQRFLLCQCPAYIVPVIVGVSPAFGGRIPAVGGSVVVAVAELGGRRVRVVCLGVARARHSAQLRCSRHFRAFVEEKRLCGVDEEASTAAGRIGEE